MKYIDPADLSGRAGLLLLFAWPAAAQGETGFLRGKGQLDLSTSYSLERYDDYKLVNPDERFDDVERRFIGLYAAYGLCDDLDLTFSAAHVSSDGETGSLGAAFDDESGLQDAALQLKWRPYETELGPGRFSWLVAPGVRVPLNDYEDYSDNPLNGLGDGATVLLARMIAHYEWRGSYAALETGYDHRNGRLDDEIPLHLSLGTTLGTRVTLQAFLTNLYALGDTVSHPRLSDERDGYNRIGFGSYVRVTDNFGLSLSVRFSDDGTNESEGLSLGSVFRF